jgi:hypothetical protein
VLVSKYRSMGSTFEFLGSPKKAHVSCPSQYEYLNTAKKLNGLRFSDIIRRLSMLAFRSSYSYRYW